jgi:RNA polymerase sigma-70 factor (ECF subfamily)
MTKTALDRAKAGDEQAFRELAEPHRDELRVHCYRMLGSLDDAEDAVQETMAAAWNGIAGFEGRASMRTWLYRIATNRCLNARRDAARRRPLVPVPPFRPPEHDGNGEATRLQPYPDVLLEQLADRTPGPEARYVGRETVELAFIRGLQLLPPRQAAAVVLRDVLDFPASEVADMIAIGTTALKGVLQRARASLERYRDDERHTPASTDAERELSRRFAEAFTAGDVDGVVALLTDDAWLAMPPAPHEYHGPRSIAAFLDASLTWRGERPRRLIPTRSNGQPAFGYYLEWADEPRTYPPSLLTLTLRGDRVRAVTHFLEPGPLRRFGLPDTLRP